MEKVKTVAKTSWCLLFIAVLFYCLDFFFRISPSLVIDQLLQQYHATAIGIASFATFFYLGYVLLQIPAGVIFDTLNPRFVLLISLLLCALCFFGFVIGDNEGFGFLMRFLIGAGSAFSFIGALYIADNYITRKYFGLVAGVLISVATIAASGAQFISAYLFQYLGWHNVFILMSLVAVVLGVVLLWVPNVKRLPQSRLNYSPRAYLQIVGRLFSDRKLLANAVIGGLFYLPTSIFAGLWGISFLNLQYKLTDEQGSLAIVLLFLGWAIGAPIVGYIAGRFHRDRLLIGLGALIAGIAIALVLYFPQEIKGDVYWLMFVFGLASSCQVVVWNVFARFGIESASGFAIAITNMIIMFLAAMFHMVVGLLMNFSEGAIHSKQQLIYSLADYHHALIIMPLAFILVIILAMFVSFRVKAS